MDSDASRLAHELNNITFVIHGYARRLEEAIGKADPRRQDVQAILAEIPRLMAAAERIRNLDAAPRRSGFEAPVMGRQPRILLVEDEPAVRDLLRQALEQRGYHVDVGCNGAEGLALCEALEPPDLLIADLILPGATGTVVAERLRQRAPDVKVLLISGYPEHPLLDEARAAGEPCMVKPFQITSFSQTVQRLLEHRRAA